MIYSMDSQISACCSKSPRPRSQRRDASRDVDVSPSAHKVKRKARLFPRGLTHWHFYLAPTLLPDALHPLCACVFFLRAESVKRVRRALGCPRPIPRMPMKQSPFSRRVTASFVSVSFRRSLLFSSLTIFTAFQGWQAFWRPTTMSFSCFYLRKKHHKIS